MRENLNVTVLDRPRGPRYQCNGCGESFTAHGIRAHQAHRHQCGQCRPIWTSLATGDTVRHPDRTESGVIVQRATAWTPNDLTADAPDEGMVQVRWLGVSGQPYWEYLAELVRA